SLPQDKGVGQDAAPQEGKVASRMSEVLSAIPLVQAFAREKYEEEQFDAVTADTVRESIRVARLEAAARMLSRTVSAVTASNCSSSYFSRANACTKGIAESTSLIREATFPSCGAAS